METQLDDRHDIAGNTLASNVSQTFAVAVPSLSHNLFVGPSTSGTPNGTRNNPYPTISQAMSSTASDASRTDHSKSRSRPRRAAAVARLRSATSVSGCTW